MPAVADEERAQSQNGLGTGTTPAHARLLEAGLRHDLAGRLGGATADGIASISELLVAHTKVVTVEIADGLADDVRYALFFGKEVTYVRHYIG